ncbi:MAG: hypothetical protein DMD31_05835 [Gemmatimonadetes bacterium]|nr:MAG: hypothetical protein DMD31_05835 [Gemmatimonadota bacterium]
MNTAPGARLRATVSWHVVAGRLCVTLLLLAGCDPASRPGDTLGQQSLGRWEWHGRVVAEPDSLLTIARLRIDTTRGGGGDVVLARYDFNPEVGEGDEYSLTLGLDLGRAHDLKQNTPYTLGSPPARIAASATVACLCRPLRPDSVRGTFLLATRGLRQITGRIDATLYFTEWNDTSRHVTYALHQRIDAIK